MEFTIKAEPRVIIGKKTKSLRKQGSVPAGVYGFNGTFNIQLSEKEFKKLYREVGHTSVVTLDLDGKKHNVYVQEVQINPVDKTIIHISFKEINLNVETTSQVPFVITGDDLSPAVKEQNSVVMLSKLEVLLRGLPKNLPHEIIIDVSKISAGDTIELKNIKLPDGVEVVHEEELEEVVVTTASAIQEEIIDVKAVQAEAAAVAAAEDAAKSEEGDKAEGAKQEKSEDKK